MISATTAPGGTIAHHAPEEIAARWNACSITCPSEVVLGSPRPRNESAVSSKIATATVSTVLATRSGATWGSTCRNTIRVWPAPSARARFTYTRSRTLFTCARITRAVLVQSRIPITMTMWKRLGPQIAATTIISGTSGMTRK